MASYFKIILLQKEREQNFFSEKNDIPVETFPFTANSLWEGSFVNFK